MVLIFCMLSAYLSLVQAIMTDFGFGIDFKPWNHIEQQNIGFLHRELRFSSYLWEFMLIE